MNITTDHLLECLQGYAKANMEKDLQIVALKDERARMEKAFANYVAAVVNRFDLNVDDDLAMVPSQLVEQSQLET